MHTLVCLYNLLNTTTRNILSLSIRHSCHFLMETRIALLGLPSMRSVMTEQDFNLLDRLATGFWVGKPELDCSTKTERSEDDEEAPSDVEECGWDEEANGEVEEPISDSLVKDKLLLPMVWGCRDLRQFPFQLHESPVTILLPRRPSKSERE